MTADTTPVTTILTPGTSPAKPAATRISPPPRAKIRLEIRDLDHAGARKFLSAVHASDAISEGITNVLRKLYLSPHDAPPVRSVTLILRAMSGVAYTTGSDLDDEHKEIHFSLGYIAGLSSERVGPEITGVVTHELVHCFQWNGFDTCPSGLIEGIADWVRLRCHLAPPHWKKTDGKDGAWDAGYQHTAYFLDFLERMLGEGFVRRVNAKLRRQKYDAGFWTQVAGRDVDELWKDYVDTAA